MECTKISRIVVRSAGLVCCLVAGLVAAAGIAGCGSENEGTADEVGTVSFRLEQPSLPLAVEGTSTGIRLLRGGEVAYSGDFWKLPKGRENPNTGMTTYALDDADLEAGDYRVLAVIRACNAAGCSESDLGEPALRCTAHFQVKAGAVRVLTVVARRLDARECGFAYTYG